MLKKTVKGLKLIGDYSLVFKFGGSDLLHIYELCFLAEVCKDSFSVKSTLSVTCTTIYVVYKDL